ncbi:MAG: succinate dehydrogenase cytochrome b subunit [Gemmatimonadetes bacterium]|uniref:Succinate dehydrogenase cytochrome b subunit n=1 Tax=Candidatus Kutchimonas denitrificans TaxID=3056748 RepID=A0AAE5CCP8_9BACT|nr:succinate dehydrogenase cytochrome b subunit [Gemmatimonadota bacterium]NIR75960.1 succinate dehydrogenase cytochrome b subunit [Candidatus Kutchimonas denitrificans]NIS02117.1 succinate dehydrogenase cytochrome b subunit [Gemmatimonadota bacterium]NIT67942.1 succinate dehydrogenase cytochrome b subunit [Gemmatimonadota bacterium]NIU53936.1 succinate dehydrogenase [Gemmatimonadota bacterium]
MASLPIDIALDGSRGRIAAFFATTVGKKMVMAVTGIVLVVFVIGHMIGNLQVYIGPEAINHYGELLRELLHGGFIWVARGGLLAAVLLHIWAATALTLDSWKARPVGYRRRQQWTESTYASRTMRWGGPILLIFIVYHLLHFTTGTAHNDFVAGDVYHNVVAGFSIWWVSAFYIFAQLVLGLHLYHGVWSMLQTLGLSHPSYNRVRFGISALITAVVVVGNISIPIAVLAGVVS